MEWLSHPKRVRETLRNAWPTGTWTAARPTYIHTAPTSAPQAAGAKPAAPAKPGAPNAKAGAATGAPPAAPPPPGQQGAQTLSQLAANRQRMAPQPRIPAGPRPLVPLVPTVPIVPTVIQPVNAMGACLSAPKKVVFLENARVETLASTAALTLPSGHARSNAAMAPGAAHTVALRPLQPAALLCCSLCGSTLPSGSCGGDPNA